MSFLKRHKVTTAAFAVLVLVAGAAHFTGCPLCGTNCPWSSMFSATVAHAGPGCCSSSSKASGVCDADSKTKATTASATQANATASSKEECVKALMAKGMTKEQAEAAFNSCHGNGSATTANATGVCPYSGKSVASLANASDGKSCSAADKEACITKCMAEKGITRADAEAFWAKRQAMKTANVTAAVATETTPVPSREACIDAMVARGMTRAEAEAHMSKCEQLGMTAQAAVLTVEAKSTGTCQSAMKSCCAGKGTAAKTTAAATTAPTAPGGSK